MYHFIALLVGTVALPFTLGTGFEDDKVTLAETPSAVVNAVKERFPGAEIRDRVEKETKRAGVFYEFELLRDGKKTEAEVSAEGRFREIEIELTASDLPKTVANAIAERFPAGQVMKAKEEIQFRGERETKVYDVEVLVNGDELDVKIDPNGKILRIDD